MKRGAGWPTSAANGAQPVIAQGNVPAAVQTEIDELKAKIAGSKLYELPTFGKTRRGYIGIQDHGDDGVWYRNIKIRVLR